MELWDHTRNVIKNPNIDIGEYTYYNHFDLNYNVDYARSLAPYLHEDSKEKLIIGRFCSIAHGVVFITSSANHQYDGFSTYPFAAFDDELQINYTPHYEDKGDNIVGHDVWIGRNATIMPGVRIGSGVIIGASAIVTKDIPDYCVVAGNPGRIIRTRFDDQTIEALLKMQWWNWSEDKIHANIDIIVGKDIQKLIAVSKV